MLLLETHGVGLGKEHKWEVSNRQRPGSCFHTEPQTRDRLVTAWPGVMRGGALSVHKSTPPLTARTPVLSRRHPRGRPPCAGGQRATRKDTPTRSPSLHAVLDTQHSRGNGLTGVLPCGTVSQVTEGTYLSTAHTSYSSGLQDKRATNTPEKRGNCRETTLCSTYAYLFSNA